MAVWADFDEDDEPSLPSLVPDRLTSYTPQIVPTEGDVVKEPIETGSVAYIAHALRCYPYAQLCCHISAVLVN